MYARLLHPNCALLIAKAYTYATIVRTETFISAGLDSLVQRRRERTSRRFLISDHLDPETTPTGTGTGTDGGHRVQRRAARRVRRSQTRAAVAVALSHYN
jgi:hypothetical protein